MHWILDYLQDYHRIRMMIQQSWRGLFYFKFVVNQILLQLRVRIRPICNYSCMNNSMSLILLNINIKHSLIEHQLKSKRELFCCFVLQLHGNLIKAHLNK